MIYFPNLVAIIYPSSIPSFLLNPIAYKNPVFFLVIGHLILRSNMAMVNPIIHPTQWWLASLIPYGSHLKSEKSSVDCFWASLSYQNPIQNPPFSLVPLKSPKSHGIPPIFAGFSIPNEGDHPIKIQHFCRFSIRNRPRHW